MARWWLGVAVFCLVGAVAQAQDAINTQVEGLAIDTHPQVLAAEAAVRDAALMLKRSELRSPVAAIPALATSADGPRRLRAMPSAMGLRQMFP